MAKKKSQNHASMNGGGKRGQRPGEPAGGRRGVRGVLGRLGRRRTATPANRTAIKRSRLRRERTILALIAVAILAGVGSLGASLYLAKVDHDWASVATVNGHSISREALRGRMAVLKFLAQEREAFVAKEGSSGRLPSDQAVTLEQAAAASTSVEAARQSLINDELLRELAARDGIATPASPDSLDEGTSYATADLAHRVRYIRFGLPGASATVGSTPSPTAPSGSWPAASKDTLEATIARIRAEFTSDTPVTTIVADLHDAGWQVFGQDAVVSAGGIPSDPTVELDSSIAAETISGSPGAVVGPTVDAYGRTNIGKVLDPPDSTMAGRLIGLDAYKANVDDSAFQAWADGQAMRHAVQASMLAHWRSTPIAQAHFRELVVGPAPASSGTGGPWVELSALAINRLAGLTAGSIPGAPTGLDLGADSLAKSLRSMPSADRVLLFGKLVAAANRPPAPDSTSTSGEIGFFTKDNLTTELASAAFADSARNGDILGPIAGSAGPTLYLIKSRYAGALDERAQVALRQIGSDPSPNPLPYTTQFSPADIILATDAGWRADAEFGSGEAVRTALFDTAIGSLSGPFVLDGKLALADITERRTALPDARMLDRLALDGFDAWFSSESAKATITRSTETLPELRTPMPSATIGVPTEAPASTATPAS